MVSSASPRFPPRRVGLGLSPARVGMLLLLLVALAGMILAASLLASDTAAGDGSGPSSSRDERGWVTLAASPRTATAAGSVVVPSSAHANEEARVPRMPHAAAAGGEEWSFSLPSPRRPDGKERSPRVAWSPVSAAMGGGNGWAVAMLSAAEAYFSGAYGGADEDSKTTFYTAERMRLAETVERCVRVQSDGYAHGEGRGGGDKANDGAVIVHRRSLLFSRRHPICKDAIRQYRAIDAKPSSASASSSSSGEAPLPAPLLVDLAASEGYCSVMRSYVWETLVPSLSAPLQMALIRQYERQTAAAASSREGEGAGVVGSINSDFMFPFEASFPHLASFFETRRQRRAAKRQQQRREREEGKERAAGERFLVWSLSGGLGNRFQSLASTLVAAMLSRRVLLVKDWFTLLPPNTKGAKPVIFPSARTQAYVLEPLANRLFNTADDAFFADDNDGDGGKSGVGGSVTEERSSGAAAGDDVLRLLFTMGLRGAGGKGGPSPATLSGARAARGGIGGGPLPAEGDDPSVGGEQLRPPNSMLLCALFPLTSLSEYRQRHPSVFAAPPPGSAAAPNGDYQRQVADDEVGREGSTLAANSNKKEVIPPPAQSREDHVKVSIAARHDKKLARWGRFACGADLGDGDDAACIAGDEWCANASQQVKQQQQSVDVLFFAERFVYVWTNQYYAPLFFSNPHTRAAMLSWFPPPPSQGEAAPASSDGSSSSPLSLYRPEGPYNVLTKLLVIPSSHVMRRVIGLMRRGGGGGDALAASHSQDNPPRLVPGRFVSLQIRAFSTNVFGSLSEAFDTCLKALRGGGGGAERLASAPVFLASLHAPVRDYFEKRYGGGRGGGIVTLAPPSHEQGTGKHYALDLDALADMFLLALSEVLLVSPGSTFGAFVAAFTDISPVRVDFHRGGGGGGDSGEVDGAHPRSHAFPQRYAAALAALPPMCRVALSQQPCFGSWFRYDKLWHRRAELRCALQPMPAHGHRCEV